MVTKEQEEILENLPYGRFNEWMEKGNYSQVYLFIIQATKDYYDALNTIEEKDGN